MRAYFFGNMYLSSIQQGIQAAHVVHEMFIDFPERTQDGGEYLWEWASCHKTMVLLNAGYAEEIRNLIAFFNNPNNPYPWSEFHESREALDEALTSVGIVLPEKIYETARLIRNTSNAADRIKNDIECEGRLLFTSSNTFGIDVDINEIVTWEFSKWEFDLCNRLNKYGLAK